MRLVFMGRVDEHETCDTIRVIGRENADAETAAGGADEHQRSANPASVEQRGELAGEAASRAGRRPRVAVTQAGAVIRADPSKSSDVRLDESPVSARAAQAGLENDSRLAGTGAPYVQPVASDVNESSWRWSGCQVFASNKPLIRRARNCGEEDEREHRDESAHRPTQHVDPQIKSSSAGVQHRFEYASFSMTFA